MNSSHCWATDPPSFKRTAPNIPIVLCVGACQRIGYFTWEEPPLHTGTHVAGNDTHPNSKDQDLFFPETGAVFLYPACSRDLLRQSPPRLRQQKLMDDRWHWRTRFLTPMPVLYGEIAKFHPTVPGDIQRLWAVFTNQPLTASSEVHPKKNAVLCPRHRAVHSTCPPGNDETNIGWFEENAPIDLPLHTCSAPGKGKAIHVAGGGIGLWGISIFPAVESTLQPCVMYVSFSMVTSFRITMVSQKSIMRN